MILEIHAHIRQALQTAIRTLWNIDPPEIVLNLTPKVELGELASPVSFELAKRLKKAPRAAATELIAALGTIPGVHKTEIAGAGYINFFLDRGAVFQAAFNQAATGTLGGGATGGKAIVEHTNINPNKAAHIGHLRNAVLGDTFVRILKASGETVETQNYIDNTGVQVADVIVGFKYLEQRSLESVRALANDPAVRFDYYCWDLYARVSGWYDAEDPKHETRGRTLLEIEEDGNETAEMAEIVATKIVRCHLATMARINVQYDLLPRESDILHLKFWERAFQRLKDTNAIFFENEGKNSGCWVMRIDAEGYDDDKIIVRSNGTVTYVGKDIAYQLWKLGLLEQDFYYRRFDTVWMTSSKAAEDDKNDRPSFGRGHTVYNVIDVRQAYPQNVVRQGVRALGYEAEMQRSIHFSYAFVTLTAACAMELGIEIPEEDQGKAHVQVSGRKGHGVKADDLIDQLQNDARKKVAERNAELPEAETATIARQIAVGALRFFMLRFTRTAIIAFDFKEALSFDGETGPYLQYAVVRANKIIRKVGADRDLEAFVGSPELSAALAGQDDVWDLVHSAARLDEVTRQVIATQEPAVLAKYSFTLAQKFNLFYHHHNVLKEEDAQRKRYLLAVVELTRRTLARALDIMGMEIPAVM